MKPPTPLVQTYACRCGGAHPKMAMIAGIPVLECPDSVGLRVWLDGNAPRFVQGTAVASAEHADTIDAHVEALRLLVVELGRSADDGAAARDRDQKAKRK